jgi:hypothetical protein
MGARGIAGVVADRVSRVNELGEGCDLGFMVLGDGNLKKGVAITVFYYLDPEASFPVSKKKKSFSSSKTQKGSRRQSWVKSSILYILRTSPW